MTEDEARRIASNIACHPYSVRAGDPDQDWNLSTGVGMAIKILGVVWAGLVLLAGALKWAAEVAPDEATSKLSKWATKIGCNRIAIRKWAGALTLTEWRSRRPNRRQMGRYRPRSRCP